MYISAKTEGYEAVILADKQNCTQKMFVLRLRWRHIVFRLSFTFTNAVFTVVVRAGSRMPVSGVFGSNKRYTSLGHCLRDELNSFNTINSFILTHPVFDY